MRRLRALAHRLCARHPPVSSNVVAFQLALLQPAYECLVDSCIGLLLLRSMHPIISCFVCAGRLKRRGQRPSGHALKCVWALPVAPAPTTGAERCGRRRHGG